jgi:carboxymethylenebutenolidase
MNTLASETTIRFGEAETLDAYLVRPQPQVECRGGLVLIHEIWGLADHIKDVAHRFAAEGYEVIAPDLLSRIGMTPTVGAELEALMHHADEEVRTLAQPRLREAMSPARAPEFARWAVPALRGCVDFLDAEPGIEGRIAVAGFCFGGSFSFALAGAEPRLRAAVPFYGTPPSITDYGSIRIPILAFYGDQDDRLMGSLPEVESSMAEAGVEFESVVYPDAGHAFFNDSNPHAYAAKPARDAWRRTLDFLAE